MTLDLESRLQRYAMVLDGAIETDLAPNDEQSAIPTDDLAAVWAPSLRLRRGTLAVIAAAGLLIGGCIALLVDRHPDTQRPTADTSPATTSATPPPSCSGCVNAADVTALELTKAPAGYALVGQQVRPAGGGDVQSAVFIQRDQQGNVTSKVVVRFGDVSLMALDGPSDPPLAPPANLATATAGNVIFERSSRLIHFQYDLGSLGNLTLETYHLDESTDMAAVAPMQQIAASLQLTKSAKIGVRGAMLPHGWELAAAGTEPEITTETRFQAFEVDVPEGGNKIIIENMATTDPNVAYWKMDETLESIDIRGHAGNVSTHQYPPTDPNAPPPANPSTATTLIWQEAPGQWVTLRADDMTTEQLLAIANQLTPVKRPHWEPPGQPLSTTTTSTGKDCSANNIAQMPLLVGRTIEDADRLLAPFCIQPAITFTDPGATATADPAYPSGIVSTQQPAAGTKIPFGAPVVLTALSRLPEVSAPPTSTPAASARGA